LDKIQNIKEYEDVAALWDTYENALKRYIIKKVKDQSIAEDLLHDVLIKVYNSCCSGIDIKNVRSWMFQIAHNTTIDFLKEQNKFTDIEVKKMEEEEIPSYREAEELIRPLIQLLPEKYAVPLKLSDLDGLKQAEVARHLNLSLTATKSRIQRARKLLKEFFFECCSIQTDKNGNPISFTIKENCEALQQFLKKF
jgi:RNA polymerase sigma-70 factor (ECF subfamily)